ncbi:unnamed protein product [Cuscuta campestris]|uniref:Ubiquitin-like protease family profile domain-containing protein n=1 Tax=Cuscuta campestris TaxID=132261 RepID=A0A484NFE9_9ASTE|nr:unnamed protein product [Cuscuta campestris]
MGSGPNMYLGHEFTSFIPETQCEKKTLSMDGVTVFKAGDSPFAGDDEVPTLEDHLEDDEDNDEGLVVSDSEEGDDDDAFIILYSKEWDDDDDAFIVPDSEEGEDDDGYGIINLKTKRRRHDDEEQCSEENGYQIPIIKTMNLVKTTTGQIYKRLCDEEILVGKTGLKVTCFCNVCVGSTTVKGVVSASKMAELKASAFGIFFKLGKIKWVNGQLLILLALNHVEPVKKSGEIWAFETFPSLKENGICVVGENRSGLWPRALRWETGVRPMHDRLEVSIFGTEEESVQWNEMVATTSEKVIENIAMLFSVGDSRKGKGNNGGGEHVDEVYGAGRRKIKGKLHWGCEGSMNHEEINVQRKEKRKVVIRKRAHVKKMQKKTERSGSGTPIGTPKKAKNVLGDARENEPSLRDIMTALVLMEKRNLKMRMEVTKLGIAVNAHTRLLNGYISRKRIGKRWHTSKKRTTEDNNMPSFDLGFESQEKNDATEHDVADDVWEEDLNVEAEIGTQPGSCEHDVVDDVWEEDLNVEAEIGTQPGSCGNDLHDTLKDISTQEVEGRWLKTLHRLGLGKQSEKNVDNQECEKGSMNMVKDGMQSGEVGKDVAVEDVLCNGVDEPKEASPMNVEVFASAMNGQENEIEVDVSGFTDNVETASQALQELPANGIFFPTEENLDENEKNPKDEAENGECSCSAIWGDEDEFMGPFPSNPNEMPAQEEIMNVEKFMYQGLLKNHLRVSGRKYWAQVDVLDPSEYKVHYGEEDTLTKTWYYNIFFPWGWLLDTHLDVIFYYLRMKGVEFGLEQRYTTTDTPFLALLKTLCGRYMKKELTIEQTMRNKTVRSTIMGGKMEYGRPWQSVDFVYMPLNMGNHWTLLVLDIKQKLIRTYDSSIKRNDSKRKLHPFLPCLQMFLPKIMDKLGVYDGREEGPVGDDVLAVEVGSSSCGMFVVKMAEFLMMGCDAGDMDDHEIAEYRKKMTVELLAYSAV